MYEFIYSTAFQIKKLIKHNFELFTFDNNRHLQLNAGFKVYKPDRY